MLTIIIIVGLKLQINNYVRANTLCAAIIGHQMKIHGSLDTPMPFRNDNCVSLDLRYKMLALH